MILIQHRLNHRQPGNDQEADSNLQWLGISL